MQVVDVNGNMFGYDYLEIIGIDGKPKTIGGGGGSTAWGSITGTLSAQTDLQSALNAKFDDPTGTSSQYIDGTGALQTFPTLTSADKMVTVGRNSTGSTLYKGTIIYILGSTGNRPNYVKAQANAEATSAGTFGVILADIPNNSDGQAVTIGTVDSLDTRSTATHPFTTDTLADGDTIYLSPTVAGYVTNVKPHAPNHIVYIGKVVRTSPTNGTIVYRIQNGYELDEIHDVQIISVANNDLLQYDSSDSLWKNKSLSAAGIQPTLTLTTTGTSGPATLVGATLNVPQYGGGGGGGSTFGTHIVIQPQSGVYYSTAPFTQTGAMSTTANTYYLAPFTPKNNLNANELRIEVTTAIAAGLATILIFSDLNGLPKTKLLESTNLDCSTTGMKTFTASFSFVAGTTYWLGASTNAVIGFRSNGSSFALQHHASSTAVNPQYAKSATFGSVPSTITVSPNSDASALQPITIRFRAV